MSHEYRRTIFLLALLAGLVAAPTSIHAQSADDLQQKINQHNADIKDLEAQITSYQKQINALGSQATTLNSTLKSLQLTQKKLEADIAVTQDKIDAKNLEIQRLGLDITAKEGNINDDQRIVSQTFAAMNQTNDDNLVRIILSGKSPSESFNKLNQLASIESNLQNRIHRLSADKTSLQQNQIAAQLAKNDLIALSKRLDDQKEVVLKTVSDQNKLLAQTKQSEQTYKKILADKQAQKDAFEREVMAFESQLKLLVDSSKLPHPGTGVLSWPLDSVTITQYFGNTPFATANPQIYNGRGHTGIDLRATIGTPIKAALSGVVVGVADTDLALGCYSYGRWVMVKHPNGLSTLYAHMSVQSVSVGQSVSTGEILGYSGNTGYTTGPHLHFGVYATQGVEIKKFDNSLHCKGVYIPVADYKAYLNPLSYL